MVERRIDDLGRLTIPAEIRSKLGLSKGMIVGISVEGDKLIVSKSELVCSICGNKKRESIKRVSESRICVECIEKIKKSSYFESVETSENEFE